MTRQNSQPCYKARSPHKHAWSFIKNDSQQFSELCYRARQEGQKPRGHPRRKWEVGIEEVLCRGTDLSRVKVMARDRER